MGNFRLATCLLFTIFQNSWSAVTTFNSTNQISLPPYNIVAPPDPFRISNPDYGTVIIQHQRNPPLPLPHYHYLVLFLEECSRVLDHIMVSCHANQFSQLPSGVFDYGGLHNDFRLRVREEPGRSFCFWQVYRVIEVLEIWARRWKGGWKATGVEYYTFGGMKLATGIIGSGNLDEV